MRPTTGTPAWTSATPTSRLASLGLACKEWKRVVDLSPENATVRYSLGRGLLTLGEVEEAVSVFHGIIHYNANDYYAYNNLGLIFARQEKYDDAVKMWRRAVHVNPRYGQAHYNLGRLFASRPP